MELLDKLQKRICRTACPSLSASLETLDHHRNKASLNLFYRYCFGRCPSELAQLAPLSFSWVRSTSYSDGLHHFSVNITRSYKNLYVNSFFPCTNKVSNSLSIVCFPFTYNLNGFKSKIKRHLSTVGSF